MEWMMPNGIEGRAPSAQQDAETGELHALPAASENPSGLTPVPVSVDMQTWVAQIQEALDDKKGQDIRSFFLNSAFADAFIIVSALSSRHVWTLCDAVEKVCRDHGVRPLSQGKSLPPTHRGAGIQETRWIVVDAGGVFVHIFSPEARDHYGLEDLWTNSQSPQTPAEKNR